MTYVIFTDGGCRGNPGPSSAGVYIPHLDLKLGFPLETTTNNVAEYMALISGLRVARSVLSPSSQLMFKADSELMVRQMEGRYKVSSPNLINLWEEAKRLAEIFISVEYVHVPRSMNAVADKICNLTLDAMALGYKGSGIRWGDLDSIDRQMEMLLDTAFLT